MPPVTEGNATDFTNSHASIFSEHTGHTCGSPGSPFRFGFFFQSLHGNQPGKNGEIGLRKSIYPIQSKIIPIITKPRTCK